MSKNPSVLLKHNARDSFTDYAPELGKILWRLIPWHLDLKMKVWSVYRVKYFCSILQAQVQLKWNSFSASAVGLPNNYFQIGIKEFQYSPNKALIGHKLTNPMPDWKFDNPLISNHLKKTMKINVNDFVKIVWWFFLFNVQYAFNPI